MDERQKLLEYIESKGPKKEIAWEQVSKGMKAIIKLEESLGSDSEYIKQHMNERMEYFKTYYKMVLGDGKTEVTGFTYSGNGVNLITVKIE